MFHQGKDRQMYHFHLILEDQLINLITYGQACALDREIILIDVLGRVFMVSNSIFRKSLEYGEGF